MISLRTTFVSLSLMLAILPGAHAVAGEQPLRVDSQEYKLLLKPERFTHKEQAIAYYWRAVQQAAKNSGVGAEPAKKMFKEKTALYRYLDDATHRLNAQNYILRVVQPYDNGQPGDKVNVMLKYRVAGGKTASAADLQVAANYQAATKLEQDIVGFMGGVIGHNETENSLSAQIKNLPYDAQRTQVGQYADLFPTLSKLRLSQETLLQPVGSDILSIGVTPGTLTFSDGSKSKLSMAIWYQQPDNRLMVGEISFDIKIPSEGTARITQSELFFNALQQQLQNDMQPGATKTAQVYLAAQP